MLKGKDASWPGTQRGTLLLVTLVFPLAWHFALTAVSPFLFRQFGKELMGAILPFALLAPLVALIHFGLNRLANLGMSRWWSLAVFAPILNLWLGYRCFACPPGYAYNKKMDGAGFALTAVYCLTMLSGISILTADVTPLLGLADSPVLPEQLRSLIRSAASHGTSLSQFADFERLSQTISTLRRR